MELLEPLRCVREAVQVYFLFDRHTTIKRKNGGHDKRTNFSKLAANNSESAMFSSPIHLGYLLVTFFGYSLQIPRPVEDVLNPDADHAFLWREV